MDTPSHKEVGYLELWSASVVICLPKYSVKEKGGS